ncbi:MAG TPA: ABC transporter permease [Vicinamibacterales bacterium]|nr:ABC transporter permease [Vicinamibacterales bacterium]
MDALLADIRYGFRLFRKSPGFSLVAVLTLALGIGANTAIFSVIDALLLRPLPYANPDQVVMVWEDAWQMGFHKNTPAPGNYNDWVRLNHSMSGIAATRGSAVNVTGDGAPEQIIGRGVTPNFFAVLGTAPVIGRTFTDAEDRANAKVVIISYGLWQRRYGGDPSIVGKALLLNGVRWEVIGVMPRAFVFRSRDVDYWMPIALAPNQINTYTSHFLNVVGRLAPGVTVAAARDDMNRVAEAIRQQHADTNKSIGVTVVPIREDLMGDTRTELLVLMAAAAAVLLIACANLASLLMSRAVGRRGEMAVRAAIGATRWRLVRQLFIEATVFSVAGGALGLALAPAGVAVIAQLAPRGFAVQSTSLVNIRLLLFTAVVALATGFAFSLVPAVQAARTSLRDAMQQGARSAVGGRGRIARDAMVVAQLAAALVLLVGAGLMLRTLANLHALDLGFRPDHLLTLRTTLPQAKYPDQAKRVAFYNRVIADVRALPGVVEAGYGQTLPFMSPGNTSWFGIEGRPIPPPSDRADGLFRPGTGTYLKALGVTLVEGRLLDDRDGADAPRAVVINETLARQFFPGQSPIGQRMWFNGLPPTAPFYTIVGVIKDIRENGYQPALRPAYYFATAQSQTTADYLVIRTQGRPEDLTEPVRRIIARVDPDQPVSAIRTLDDIVASDVADREQQMVLLASFAALALLLASVGIYGVLSFGVAQQSRELGLRIALGASRVSIMRLVVGRGLTLTVSGIAIGTAIAWAVMRALQSLLYGVATTDLPTFAAVIGCLTATALAACYFPAHRASRLDPIAVLRDE